MDVEAQGPAPRGLGHGDRAPEAAPRGLGHGDRAPEAAPRGLGHGGRAPKMMRSSHQGPASSEQPTAHLADHVLCPRHQARHAPPRHGPQRVTCHPEDDVVCLGLQPNMVLHAARGILALPHHDAVPLPTGRHGEGERSEGGWGRWGRSRSLGCCQDMAQATMEGSRISLRSAILTNMARDILAASARSLASAFRLAGTTSSMRSSGLGRFLGMGEG